jgi:two-component system KDP operon response regulator KdpE
VVLANHAGSVVSTPQLLREVWGINHLDDAHYLRIHMSHLRQTLEDDPTDPAWLLTETGVGDRLLLPV